MKRSGQVVVSTDLQSSVPENSIAMVIYSIAWKVEVESYGIWDCEKAQ